MPSFILRDLDPSFWAKVQAQAKAEGVTVKARILELLRTWLGTAAAIALVVLTTACVDPKVPPYVLTAPSAVEAPVPIPPVPAVVVPLTVDLHGPTDPHVFASAAFTAFAANLMGEASYRWTFGDGASLVTAVGFASHTYGQVGPVTASVHITEPHGDRSADASIAILILPAVVRPSPPPPPTAPPAGPPSLSASLTCTPGTRGTLTSCNVTASYAGSTLPGNTITHVGWDWADGAVSHSLAVATHTYQQAGTYTIFATVTAWTVDGAKDATATAEVKIP